MAVFIVACAVLLLATPAWASIEERKPLNKKAMEDYGDFVLISKEEQEKALKDEYIKCYFKMRESHNTTQGYCPLVWDGMMCWPESEPGHIKVQKCPDFINGFRISAKASRTCMPDGTWFFHPDYNNTWSNYTQCMHGSDPQHNSHSMSKTLQEHVEYISSMSVILYSISLVSLLLAFTIMLYFKKLHCPRNFILMNLFVLLILHFCYVTSRWKLHCPRNIIHMNLFVSLILRAILAILRDRLLVGGLGFSKDVQRVDGMIKFKENGAHWECKLLMTLFHYALTANYMWLFVEGLYLHMLIFVSLFSEKSRVTWYILIGWLTPLPFIIAWVIVRVLLDNQLCWNTWHLSAYIWIIKGPIAATIIANFIFFLNIVRVLFTKLSATNSSEAKKYRYKKLAKSTLVLIPLYGVPYILFLGMPNELDEKLEIAKLYFEMAFSSIQGLLVAFLFCFLNGEVQSEVRKCWQRMRLRHGHLDRGSQRRNTWNTWNTSMTYVPTQNGQGHNGVRPSIQSTISEEDGLSPNGTRLNGGLLSNGNYTGIDPRLLQPPQVYAPSDSQSEKSITPKNKAKQNHIRFDDSCLDTQKDIDNGDLSNNNDDLIKDNGINGEVVNEKVPFLTNEKGTALTSNNGKCDDVPKTSSHDDQNGESDESNPLMSEDYSNKS